MEKVWEWIENVNIGYGVIREVQCIGSVRGAVVLMSLDFGNGSIDVVGKGSGSIESKVVSCPCLW